MKNASFSNVDGPRNDHTKGSKSERKTETMIPLYVESKIKNERTYLGNTPEPLVGPRPANTLISDFRPPDHERKLFRGFKSPSYGFVPAAARFRRLTG